MQSLDLPAIKSARMLLLIGTLLPKDFLKRVGLLISPMLNFFALGQQILIPIEVNKYDEGKNYNKSTLLPLKSIMGFAYLNYECTSSCLHNFYQIQIEYIKL